MTWEKFKAMPFRKKAEHIWEYYRWHILVVLVVLLCVGSWIRGFVTYQEPLMQVEMVNAYGASAGGEAFEAFLTQEGRPWDAETVAIGKNIQLNSQDPSQTFAAAQMLFCTIAAGEPDLIFWDTDEVLPPLDGGALMDLRELLPEDFLKAREDSLVYAQNEDTGEKYPCGIYTERNPWVMENKFYVNCTVAVPFSCRDKVLAADFLRYLLEYGA